jgi:hypothetical protein
VLKDTVMVFPQYPGHQPEAIPYPTDYDDQYHQRDKRSRVFAASVSGLIAVLVLAVGVLLGLQLSQPDPDKPVPTSPTPSVAASAPSRAPSTTEPRDAGREAQRRRAEEAARLDRSTYKSINAREFALMVKNPDSWAGRKILVYGVVTQFDAATGTTAFRADTGPSPMTDPYDYNHNTFITAHDSQMVANVVQGDMVTMFVEVQGAYTYDTQIGGSTTVPALLVNIIEPTNRSSPTASQRPLPPSVPPYPTLLPTSESTSGSQLRAIAASDQPVVLNGLAERWVPQLSSKRTEMVAEGRTWTDAMILSEHQQLRGSYPGVRLLWSRDWSTFSDSNFWVTIAGTPFATAEQALAWCTSSGFDRDHCYAKLISTTQPVEGSTAYNK